jgi:hypothetical protein
MGNLLSIVLIRFRLNPSPGGLNYTDHSLPAGMHVDVLYDDLLLPLATVSVERVEQHCEGARELAGLVQVFTLGMGIFFSQGEPEAFHRGGMHGQHLNPDHFF